MNLPELTFVKNMLKLFGAPVKPPDHARISKHVAGHTAPGTQPQQRAGRPKSKARRIKALSFTSRKR